MGIQCRHSEPDLRISFKNCETWGFKIALINNHASFFFIDKNEPTFKFWYLLRFMTSNDTEKSINSQVLLLRQLWIINYNVKCSTYHLINENKNWCFQRNDIYKIVHFGILIHILSWNIYYWEKNTNWKSTIIWQNNFCYIIWRSRTRLLTIVRKMWLRTIWNFSGLQEIIFAWT